MKYEQNALLTVDIIIRHLTFSIHFLSIRNFAKLLAYTISLETVAFINPVSTDEGCDQ